MYSYSRSPATKLVIALAINLVLVAICQRYWAFTNSHAQYQIQIQQQQIQLEQHQQQQLLLEKQQQQFFEEQRRLAVEAKVAAEKAKERKPLSTFKVPKDLHLTHDLAIPRDIPAWTEADTAFLDTVAGFSAMTQILKNEYAKSEVLTDKDKLDFAEMSRAERVYKSLWNHVYPIYQALPGRDRDRERALLKLAESRPEIDYFIRLERKLFPWVHLHRKTSFSLFESYSGKGYVLCAGNFQFEFIVASIQAIRSKIKSDLPIQVFHMGEYDLSPERQAYVRDMTTNIEVIDITTIFDNGYMQLGGWAIKAFAILASRFEEAMLIDSDVFFLRNPDELFQDPGYMAMGALFFYDRTLHPDWKDGPNWLRSMMPIMSSFPETTRTFRGLSSHEQESGVVVVNKKTRFTAMLAVCKMNGKWERDLWSYKVFYGDKETFWTGFEMIQEPYAFMRNFGGVVGELRPDNDQSVCGAQLHQDHLGRPMWWNGGIMRNKNEGVKRDLDFGFWMAGGGQQTKRERILRDADMVRELVDELEVDGYAQVEKEPGDAVWDFRESCLAGAAVNPLDDRELWLAQSYLRLDKVAKEEEEKFKQKVEANPRDRNWVDI